jgi:adenylate kinase family enzyme
MSNSIHIFGASGSGTTTLGRALAEHLNYIHFDTDDYFWSPTDPPFTQKRETTLRQQHLMDDLTAHESWVLSGSLCGWGNVAIPSFDLVTYLWVPCVIRLERLRQREHERYGERITASGNMYEQSQAFLDWVASYDEGGLDMRSRQRHEKWLGTLPCPIICIEGEYTIEEQLDVLMMEIRQ